MNNPNRPPQSLPAVTYSSVSQSHSPAGLLAAMVRDLLASRELAWRLTVRDISARYRQSILGYVWAILPPIVSTFTFVLLNRSGFRFLSIARRHAAEAARGFEAHRGGLEGAHRVAGGGREYLPRVSGERGGGVSVRVFSQVRYWWFEVQVCRL